MSAIRTAIAVSPFRGKFAPIPLIGDLNEILPRVADLGYDAVELHVRQPDDVSPTRLDALLARSDLRVSAFATGHSFTVDGLSFADPDAVVRAAAVERQQAFIQRAGDLGAALFVGFVRGKVHDEPEQRAQGLEHMADSLKRCCEFGAPLGVDLLLEPINRYEMSDFNTTAEALAFADRVGLPNFRLLLDTFHMNIEEPSITAAIRAASGRCPYIHVVDSNRWAPGFGHLDFDDIARTLRDFQFSGVISAEALPKPDGWACAQKAIEIYRQMIAVVDESKS